MRNEITVPAAWQDRRQLSQGELRTDGYTVWSYGLIIGVTRADGAKVAVPSRCSVTTSRHSRGVERVCDDCADFGRDHDRTCAGHRCWHVRQALGDPGTPASLYELSRSVV